MSKIGVELKIDVSKINKELLFQGKKGTYLDAVVFIDQLNEDEYGNSGMITQKVPKDGEKNSGAILGNCKVFWKEAKAQEIRKPQSQEQKKQLPQSVDSASFDDDIPF